MGMGITKDLENVVGDLQHNFLTFTNSLSSINIEFSSTFKNKTKVQLSQ